MNASSPAHSPLEKAPSDTCSARLAAWGSIVMWSGIALGAFGAHGLKSVLTPELLAVYEKAVFYQLINGVALVFLPLLSQIFKGSSKGIMRGWWIIALGVVIFSGSLYAYVLSGIRRFAMITPLGGSLLIVGWLAITLALFSSQRPKT
jgi:uncharacterized membrane protein YgdD (TMEM256/DUF423 family)